MIGFFDSGLGGLSVLREVEKLLPDYSYVYLGDNARTPYGSRTQETIYQFTREGVEYLFKRGAELIILACNTSSSAALRRIQQEYLPLYQPQKRVLGILIPTAEEISTFTKSRKVGILATEATVNSGAYVREVNKFAPDIKVYQQACPLFVPLIEAGELEWVGVDLLVQKYLGQLFSQSDGIDVIVLCCTHYAVIENKIRSHLPQGVDLISQGGIIAKRLKDYLRRHPEIDARIQKGGSRVFLTTEKSDRVSRLASLCYGRPISLEIV